MKEPSVQEGEDNGSHCALEASPVADFDEHKTYVVAAKEHLTELAQQSKAKGQQTTQE
jgi:hypothetical protein